ncbi:MULTISPECIES: hypothetical protein [Rhizobium/Agrobacterium group]|nr:MULTISPECIES: hypothetical protein [Rhizobium/Agrobacterium group]AHK04720.1 hypothetical protein X971_4881 [Agrobacterium tumefaciens LBA4213 (Ach5)]
MTLEIAETLLASAFCSDYRCGWGSPFRRSTAKKGQGQQLDPGF